MIVQMMQNCVIFLIFFLYFANIPAECGNNETELLALLAFKESVVDPSGALYSWKLSNGTVDYCSWKGISCGRKHQSRVVSINLESQGLVGSLSPHVGNLSFLRAISLQNNSFYGPIPQEIGRLRRLVKIEFSNNSFDGEIPRNLSNCQNLFYLNLIDNNLTGIIPFEISSLFKLAHLGLSENDFSGSTLPPFLGNLTSLIQLSLMNCGFEGKIPVSLVHLKNLRYLKLHDNRLTGEIPFGLFNSSTIHSFSMSSNQLQGNIPSDIGLTLPNMRIFSLENNYFTGFLPISLSNASFLQYVGLGFNSFAGPMPKSLNLLSDLQLLTIASANIEDDISFVSSLTNCTNLIVVDIADNRLTGFLPPSIANLSIQLQFLSMANNQIHGTIPPGIGNLIGLGTLYLLLNRLSGPIPSDISKLSKLQRINLSANRLTNELPSLSGNLTLLTSLIVAENDILGSIPPSLVNCSRLLDLDLSVNNLSGPIPSEIMSLSSISDYLDLSHNTLSGSIPSKVGSLTNLATLDLSNNRLSGVVPSTISSCISLERLYLEGNSFDGEIPQDLSVLRGLHDLDLSRNNFSGPIPSFLGELQLSRLNISFNKLEGPVPIKGVFQNRSAISLEGNHALCGGIPELKLAPCSSSNHKSKNSNILMKVLTSIGVSSAISIVILACLYRLIQRKIKSRKNGDASSFESQFQRLSYADLMRATGGFSEENKIGSGRFGSVYKGILNDGSTVVAVKVINLHVRGASKSFQRECNALRGTRHRNLLKLLSISVSIDFQGNDFTALIYQFKANGSLEEWLHHNPAGESFGEGENIRYLTLMQRLNIAIDIASALEYLHNGTGSTIVHGDLKPSNILLDDDMSAHVGDFGLAKIISNVSGRFPTNESDSIAIRGTIGYIAPEYGMSSTVSTQGDVYSYGILLLELFTSIRPTNDAFGAHANLHNFVANGLPKDVMKIVEPLIMQNECQVINNNLMECVASILGIGVACSRELLQDRISMANVVIELNRIRISCQV